MITDFLSGPSRDGDAYVIAPDGSRAALVWESGCGAYFRQVLAPEERPVGSVGGGFAAAHDHREEGRSYLAALVPRLRPCWQLAVMARRGGDP